MKFDINRVYTAVNADELKSGSRVILADDLFTLRQKVEDNTGQYLETLKTVNSNTCTYRFVTVTSYALCYLVSEPEKPRRMTNKELAKWLAKGNGQLKLRSGDISTYFIYTKDNSYVPKDYMIRGWDETEWHEPIVQEADE